MLSRLDIRRDFSLSVLLGPLQYLAPAITYAVLYPILFRRYGLPLIGLWSFLSAVVALSGGMNVGFTLHFARTAGPDQPPAILARLKSSLSVAKQFYVVAGVVLAAGGSALAAALYGSLGVPYSLNGLAASTALVILAATAQLYAQLDAAILMARHDSASVQLVSAVAPVVAFVPAIAGALAGHPLEGLASGLLLSASIQVFAYQARLKQRHCAWSAIPQGVSTNRIAELIALMKHGSHLYSMSLGMVLREPVFRLTILLILGLESVGVYDIAYRITKAARDVVASGFSALYPILARLTRERNSDLASELIQISIVGLTVGGLLTLGFVLTASGPIFTLWLGTSSESLESATHTLAMWQFLTLLNVPFWYLLQAAHFERAAARALWAHTGSVILLPISARLVDLSLQSVLYFWLITSVVTQALIFYQAEVAAGLFLRPLKSKSVVACVALGTGSIFLGPVLHRHLLSGGGLAADVMPALCVWAALVSLIGAAGAKPFVGFVRSLKAE